MTDEYRTSGLHQLDQPLPVREALAQTILFLRRRWKSMVFCGMFGLVLSVLVVSRIEPLYKSSALLMIERPRASPLDEERAVALRDQSTYLDGQIFVFYSAEILSEVRMDADIMDDPHFLPDPADWLDRLMASLSGSGLAQTEEQIEAAALRKIRNALSVRREGDSNVVNVSVSASSPKIAARMANVFVDVYISQRQAHQREEAARMADWMEERAFQIKLQLSEAEEAVAAFRTENGLIQGARGGTLSEQQLFELNAELIRTRTELAARVAAYERAQTLDQAGGDLQTLPEVQDSEIVVSLRTELLGLQRRVGDLIQQSGEDDRRVAPLREQILGVNGQIDEEIRRITAAIGNEAETLEARVVLLSASVRDAGGQSGNDDRASVTLRELERVAESYRELYQPYLANISLAQEGGSLLASGTEIISRGLPPIDPAYPPKKVIVLLLTVLGLGVGALLGLLREWFHHGFITSAQVEATLNIPVLNSLPILADKGAALDVVQDDPFAPYSEAIQVVRNAIIEQTKGIKAPIVLVTSAGTGDGKTSVSTALAASAHNAGQNVLLVDADFRRAGASRLFGALDEIGLTDILLEGGKGFEPPEHENTMVFEVMPVGTNRTKPAQLLNGKAIAAFLENARKSYDMIVIDGPPVANLVDATILAKHSDAVAFVVRWQTTSRQSVSDALRRLPADKLSGVVLNGIDPDTMANYGEIYDRYVPLLPNNAAA